MILTVELDFTPTHSLSYFPMLFLLVELVAARNENALFGLSCLKKTFFFFFKGFVFLDFEVVGRCQTDGLGGREGCVYLQRRAGVRGASWASHAAQIRNPGPPDDS